MIKTLSIYKSPTGFEDKGLSGYNNASVCLMDGWIRADVQGGVDTLSYHS